MAENSSRRILIADGDVQSTRRLAAALRARGHQVLTVSNGSKALEVAVMRAPEVVIYDSSCPFIDPATYAEIIRANPRTSAIPLLVVGNEDPSNRFRSGFREAYVQKPFNVDEVLSRIRQLVQRAEAADEVKREGELEGQLTQLPLSDLLQMLSMNRRSGTLHLSREVPGMQEEETAEIFVSNGFVLDARSRETKAEKALYRLLAWSRGTFLLEPGEPRVERRISALTEELLLEGMRQQDELAALADRIPAPEAGLALAIDPDQLPDGLHPVTEEVLGLIETFRRTDDVIDQCRAPDLEVVRALTTLIDRQLVKVLGRSSGEGGTPLVSEAVAFALMGRPVVRRRGRSLELELCVVLRSARSLRALGNALRSVQGWRPQSDLSSRELPLGELGSIRLGDSVRVILLAVPADDRYAPIWGLVGGESQGAIFLIDGDETAFHPVIPHLLERDRPVAVVGEAPICLERLGPAAIAVSDLPAGLARVLERLARRQGAAADRFAPRG
ncbi:MAG: DUF4388 domain-containing protein [Deltaproteobacteria bacterium]|nr:DUF4388 domain-containing protein [Deltaproteobacteria bacterium]